MVLLGGCTETVVQCRAGYVPADGMEGRTRCALADAGAAMDAGGDAGAAMDAGGDAVVPMDTCNAAAADPPGDGQDTNCDGVDGVLGDTIFVAMGGADTNAGTAPDQPVRTVSRALDIARVGARRSILVAVGSYDALPVALGDGGTESTLPTHVLVDGVTLSGRYPGGAGAWVGRSAAAGDRSLLRGQVFAAILQGMRTSVSFHEVDLVSERNELLGGVSCYGLVVEGSGVVTLRGGMVQACAGSSALTMPARGEAGRVGDEGQDATSGGSGGVGCSGGSGGQGGGAAVRNGASGAVGSATMAGVEAAGGEGGVASRTAGSPGSTGAAGAAGRSVTLGDFGAEGYAIPRGETGERGGGGGGGGGGFASSATDLGGGGGGGGCGGGGGEPGRYGGASIGVYAWGDSMRVNLTDTTIRTLGGGDGAAGAEGGAGGAGSRGGAGSGSGAPGGPGGTGGRGGTGSAGTGGPSIGVLTKADGVIEATRVTWTVGMGGASGVLLGPRGLQEQMYRVPRP